VISDYQTSQQNFFELPSSFCQSPEKRKMKWSPCSRYLLILSSDNTLLILSTLCEEIGLIHGFGSQFSLQSIIDFFPFECCRKGSSIFELTLHVVSSNADCATLKIVKNSTLKTDNFEIEVCLSINLEYLFVHIL
jgi:hypothetical protein